MRIKNGRTYYRSHTRHFKIILRCKFVMAFIKQQPHLFCLANYKISCNIKRRKCIILYTFQYCVFNFGVYCSGQSGKVESFWCLVSAALVWINHINFFVLLIFSYHLVFFCRRLVVVILAEHFIVSVLLIYVAKFVYKPFLL